MSNKINNVIGLQDKMTPVFNKMVKAMKSTLTAMEQVDGGSKKMFKAAQADIQKADNELKKFVNNMKMAKQEAGSGGGNNSFGSKLFEGITAANQGVELLKKGFEQLGKITTISDEMTSTAARINLINDGLQTTKEVQNMILQAANNSRAAYSTTASVVSRLGLLAKESFGSTSEIVNFAEILNKSFVVGGAGAQEQASAMYQLSQAMAAGKLQGDEFRSIMENAPMLAQAIADFTGKSKADLKEMSSQGVITSDIIKGAVFGMADDVNEKFASMPTTFAQSMQKHKNTLLMMFNPTFNFLTNGAIKFFDFIFANLDMLAYILAFVGTTGMGVLIGKIPIMIAGITTMTAKAWGMAAPWIAMNWPILVVAGLVTGLLVLFLKFPSVFGKVTGGLMAMGTVFGNILKGIWNGVLWLVNSVIDVINKIPGVSVKKLEYAKFGDVGDAYAKGNEWGMNASTKAGGFLSSLTSGLPGFGKMNNSPLGTPNDPVNVKGTVSITEEDIRLLKDVSKAEIVNRYSTLRPVLNASFGNIEKTTDVNEVLNKLVEIIEIANGSDLETRLA